MIDLRSDGVTRPTEAMYDAMRRAEVGHAAWGEDPTVNELERRAAQAMGHEAALFMPSGTMANQVALRVHVAGALSPQVLAEARCHLLEHEGAGAAVNAGAQVKPLVGTRGLVPLDAFERAIEPDFHLRPETTLIWLENTHNFAGGTVLPLRYHEDVRKLADAHDLRVHLDGARIFNAAVAQGVDAAQLGATAHSAMFCFSKSLGAPIGSALTGSRAFIKRALRVRQLMGGAMYQSGVIAAAALVALEEGPARLHEDHANARRLADTLAKAGLDIVPPETNIVVAKLGATPTIAKQFCDLARDAGVLVAPISATEVRAVTHRDASREDVDRAGAVLAGLVGRL